MEIRKEDKNRGKSRYIRDYLIVCRFLRSINFHIKAKKVVAFSQQEVGQGLDLQKLLILLSIF